MPKIIKVETNENGNSYQIQFNKNMVLWFDIWIDDGELTGDWNKYIFSTTNEQDMREQSFQNASNDEVGAYNYITALELCEQYELNNNNK